MNVYQSTSITFPYELQIVYFRFLIMRHTLILLFTTIAVAISAQTSKENWNTLGMVTISTEYDAAMGMEIQKPTVGIIAQQMDGKEVELAGFIIPLSGKLAQSHFMLSRYPQSMCFFCGKAGPETAAQVFMKNKEKVAFTEDKVTVKGILRINATDMNNLLYTIDQAEIIKD